MLKSTLSITRADVTLDTLSQVEPVWTTTSVLEILVVLEPAPILPDLTHADVTLDILSRGGLVWTTTSA